MNAIKLIILTALIAEFLLNIFADFLNLGALRETIPPKFQGVFDKKEYQKSQEYLRVNTRFGWIVSIVDLIIILAIWFSEGFNYLDQWVRTLSSGSLWQGLIFMGVLVFFKSGLSLLFDYYSTFVIEERFEFNKTDRKTFCLDRVKGFVLSILLGAPLLALILFFFESAGSHAWWYCWLLVTVFTLVIQFIAPVWIMPLFNKFSPLEDGELREAIFSYARSIDFKLDNIFVMDGSKRSSKSNAFFTGFGKNKRIVLFDTLIRKHEVNELVAVLAHEMGHYKKKHILKMMVTGILQAGIMFYILSLFISHPMLFEAFYMDHISVYAGLLFFGMLYSPIGFFIGLLMQIISRHHEFEADGFAVKTTKRPESMIAALKKLSVHNLSNLLPHPFFVFLNYSHPPVLKRIEHIETIEM